MGGEGFLTSTAFAGLWPRFRVRRFAAGRVAGRVAGKVVRHRFDMGFSDNPLRLSEVSRDAGRALNEDV